MSKRITVISVSILVLLSILAGLVWWAIGFRRGVFQELSARGFGIVLVLFALFQVTAWAIVAAALRVFQRSQGDFAPWPLIVIAALLGLATMLWGITPILGMPLILVVIVGGSVLMARIRKSVA